MDLKPYGGNNTLEITIRSIKMIVGYNCLLISYFFLQKKKIQMVFSKIKNKN